MLLTKAEVASRLRVHPGTVDRMIKDGRLTAIKNGAPNGAGHVRISEEALADYLRENTIEVNA
ncbi:MAG: helix-turn-helix domain-containing protein [Actinoallomurus sp.]